jgi:ribosome maturation factor RimP
VLRVTVDDPAGPTSLEDIEQISEEISRALDAEDPIPGRYTLEVASAGLERPLVRPQDYHRFAGRKVKVRTLEPIEGHRTFTGSIRSAGEDTFVLALDSSSGGRDGEAAVVEIPYLAVVRAKLVVDWENELRGRPALQNSGSARATGSEGGQR